MKYEIDRTRITIDAQYTRDLVEEDISGAWLIGAADIEVMDQYDRTPLYRVANIPIGAWTDTDNDHADWCVRHEGARILMSALTGVASTDPDPGWIGVIFANHCEAIGALVAAALREQYAEQEISGGGAENTE